MHIDTSQRSIGAGQALALAAAASLLGLVGLPLLFGRSVDSTEAFVWLIGGVITCLCLIVATRPMANALVAGLARLPGRGGQPISTSRTMLEIGRLVVAAAYLVVTQAILRHPLVAVLGSGAEPFLVEAIFAVVALGMLLFLLSWIHTSSTPLVEGLALMALDAAVATSGSGAAGAQDTATPQAAPPKSASTQVAGDRTAVR